MFALLDDDRQGKTGVGRLLDTKHVEIPGNTVRVSDHLGAFQPVVVAFVQDVDRELGCLVVVRVSPDTAFAIVVEEEVEGDL